jgi:hypothetical protein
VYLDIVPALDKASLPLLQIAKFTPTSRQQHPKSKPPYSVPPASPPLPTKLPLLRNILFTCILSVVPCWPCMWPQPTRTFHAHSPMFSPQGAYCHYSLDQMQNLGYIQNRINALSTATASTQPHLFFTLQGQETFSLLCFSTRWHHTQWMLLGPMGHPSQFDAKLIFVSSKTKGE